MEPRIVVALGIIAACAFGGVVALAILRPRRRRQKLRRRGIKRHDPLHKNDRRALG